MSDKSQTTEIPPGYVLVPIKPMNMLKKAAYCAGGVGDDGGADRASFEDEWGAAIKQHVEGGKPTGLLALVRPYGGTNTSFIKGAPSCNGRHLPRSH
jgi:hypothetical protein